VNRFCIVCGKLLLDGQRKLCSEECRKKKKREYNRRYYQDNREWELVRGHEYYRNNRNKANENSHRYYQNNIEKIKEYNSNYYQDNREKINMSIREYQRNNQEKIKEYQHEYYRNNQEELNEYSRGWYRRVRGLSEDSDLHKESSIEKIMREWLQENNIEFISQYYISLENSTWTHVDFYIPESNICLYVDGNYYHSLPNAKRCDEEQNRILPQMGYIVVRMGETEILEGNRPWKLGRGFVL